MGAIIMIVYESTKQLFVEDVVQDRIEENIDRKFYEKMGYHTSESERKAWNNSMQYMMKVLIDNNIPIPKIVLFETLVKYKKNIKLMHTYSINDLIKEVYRNV